MSAKQKKISLSPDLEKALLRAIAAGISPQNIVRPEELGKKAKVIHGAIDFLLKKKAKLPLTPAAIQLAAHSLFGVEKKALADYLRTFEKYETGPEINEIVRVARSKALLLNLVNEAGEQLTTGKLEINNINRLIETNVIVDAEAKPFSELVGKKFKPTPPGFLIKSLPQISEVTHGVKGIWVIGGEPGLGKSTLCWQIAMEVSREAPVLYYDLDGTGEENLLERVRHIVDGDVDRFKKLTKNIYLRTSISTFEADIERFKPPCLFVMDSAQTLSTSVKYQKEMLDSWMGRFKGYTQKGYTFLLVSEKQRAEYGEANIGGFKGSGNIEYTGTLCAHIMPVEDDDDLVKFNIVKNRHGPGKGDICALERDEDRTYWFKEVKV